MPEPKAELALAIQFQLSRSQWWSLEQLREGQRTQLQALLGHAGANNRLWARRLADAGWDGRGPLTWEAFHKLPLLDRGDFREGGLELRCPVPKEHGQTYEARTSGSTGRPVVVQKTELGQLFWQAITLREHLWHRRDLTAKLAIVRMTHDAAAQPPRGRVAGSWGPATRTVADDGPSVLMSIRVDPKKQAKWLRREDPAYLLTYPSNLRALAKLFARRGKRVSGLRQIRTVSEMLTPEIRAEAEAAFGVPVVDAYSTQEVGYLALQCPEHPHYHVQSETVLVEVLREDGTPCGPGEVGRVVVSDLHNLAQPILRYDLGDFAEVGEPCPCGRGLPVLTRILGRVRNLLVYPDGRRAWPVFHEHRLVEVAPVVQFQIVQRSLERLELRVVCSRPLTGPERHQLGQIVAKRVEHPFAVSVVEVSHIERSAGGKFEEFRSEVDPDSALRR